MLFDVDVAPKNWKVLLETWAQNTFFVGTRIVLWISVLQSFFQRDIF